MPAGQDVTTVAARLAPPANALGVFNRGPGVVQFFEDATRREADVRSNSYRLGVGEVMYIDPAAGGEVWVSAEVGDARLVYFGSFIT